MAKKSWIAREKKRQKLVEKYAERRAELKASGDFAGLAKLPRNSSTVRLTNRCQATGRRHGYFRKFGCSRLVLREEALHGLIPGVTKASW
jgi:small subunit ribosomal protein S14